NKILSKLEEKEKLDVNASYEEWQKIIKNLPESNQQIRFLRQYYNAYQFLKDTYDNDKIKVDAIKKATKSKLIHLYDKIISRNPSWLLEELKAKSESYKKLVNSEEDNALLQKALLDLSYVKAASAYTTLLLLKEYAKVNNDILIEIINVYIKFFIRRNVTDSPPTRDLDTIQVNISEAIFSMVKDKKQQEINGEWLYEQLKKYTNISSLTYFREKLHGKLYDENRDMTRFLLIKMEERGRTVEHKIDFWARNNKGKYFWTIEHIFPQGKNIPTEWVKMISNGNETKAKEIQEDCVHKLGNLTLSGYNSTLSNKDFYKKQGHEIVNEQGDKLKIGYRNNLNLNKLKFEHESTLYSLENTPKWNKDFIYARTAKVVSEILEYFKFDDETNTNE
ncbi:MAG: GmrSD restriction endonuclease domain-containing protein, partial [Saprospiraceae bacterium]